MSQQATGWQTALVALGLAAAGCAPAEPEEEDAATLPVAVAGAELGPGDPARAEGDDEADEVAVEVTMTDTRFTPASVSVSPGGTVVWRNTSSMVHTVTGDGFDSGPLGPGATYRRSFSTPGSHAYHCVPHRAAGMVGTVIVK